MKNSQIKLALIQHIYADSVEQNLKNLEAQIRRAAESGANLIALPELHNNHYFCQTENPQNFDLAELLDGPTTSRLGVLAEQLNVVIIGSIFEKRAAGLYHNTAVVLDSNGTLVGWYRKMHIPDDPGYHEKYYFAPGDLGFNPVKTSLGKIGVLICWDQWFPEAARLMALAGAEILIYPTAIGWDRQDSDEEKERQLDAWFMIQRAHAIANGIPLAAVNRTGFEPEFPGAETGIDFWGNSFIAGPQGEMLAQASTGECQVLLAEIDLNRSEQVRRIWPYLRDRRIDAYKEISQRFRDQSDISNDSGSN